MTGLGIGQACKINFTKIFISVNFLLFLGVHSSAWLERSADNRKIAGSNPAGPISLNLFLISKTMYN